MPEAAQGLFSGSDLPQGEQQDAGLAFPAPGTTSHFLQLTPSRLSFLCNQSFPGKLQFHWNPHHVVLSVQQDNWTSSQVPTTLE